MTHDEVLAALVDLEVCEWTYKVEPDRVRHMGPMAQDFAAAFGLGDNDKVIFLLDAVGVLMVAVQALHRRVVELEEGRTGAIR